MTGLLPFPVVTEVMPAEASGDLRRPSGHSRICHAFLLDQAHWFWSQSWVQTILQLLVCALGQQLSAEVYYQSYSLWES